MAAAILIQYQAPIFVALYTLFFLGTKLPPIVFAAMAGSLFGCYLVVGGYSMDLLDMNRAGVLSALASAVTFAWYTVRCEYGMKRYPPWTVVFYGLLFAAVTWNIFHPPLSAFLRPSGFAQWGWVLFIAFFGTVLAFICYTEGINRIGAARASITATLEPITAGFIAWLLLGRQWSCGRSWAPSSSSPPSSGCRQAERREKTAESPLDFFPAGPIFIIRTLHGFILTGQRTRRLITSRRDPEEASPGDRAKSNPSSFLENH